QFWSFNGNVGMSETPFFSAKRGETIRLVMVNETAWPHSIHLHGHHFRVLSRSRRSDNSPISASEYGPDAWRDTVLMQADEKVEIAFVADNPGKWMLHCHMLEHQAAGMGTWYEVV
ncbi:MAG: multicopper oxidase domain-containing protein, partial [Pseudomonadota bacterium]